MSPLPSGDPAAAAFAQALLLGLALGLLYDLLRPLRRRAGRAGSAADLLFALLAGLAVFLFGMHRASGRAGLWELAAALVAFLLWENFLCRFKQSLPRFIAHIRAKKEKANLKFRQKRASKI